MASYTVGEAAKAAGVTARAVRLYEARGLVSESRRSSSGYRLFNDEDVETLAFVRRARSLGLSLDAIAEIIGISRNGAPCERTRALLDQRVAEIDATVADLLRLRETIVAAQGIECGEGIRCAVIEGAVPARRSSSGRRMAGTQPRLNLVVLLPGNGQGRDGCRAPAVVPEECRLGTPQ